MLLRSRVWIVMRQTEMTQPGCTKMAISQLLLVKASSNLVGRKSKCYFIIKFSLLLSIILCLREIRPDTGKTKMSLLQVLSDMTTQRSGFGQNSFVADEQACVLGSFELNKHSVLKIFTINGLNFQTM